MLECKNISAGYISGKQIFPVLKNVSINIQQGEFNCLAGPNGGGKSTLLKLLSGIEDGKKDSLKILSAEKVPSLDGKPISEFSRSEISKRISFMEQTEFSAWDVTVRNMLLTGRFAWSGTRYTDEDFSIVEMTADLLGIGKLLDKSVYNLSGGEFQKARIARSLCQKPDYLLLDEPCAGLDISCEPELLELLKNISRSQKTGILISIHNINLAARFSDRMILLPSSESQICGTPEEIMTAENLKKTYGKSLNLYTHPILNIPQIY